MIYETLVCTLVIGDLAVKVMKYEYIMSSDRGTYFPNGPGLNQFKALILGCSIIG